MTNIVYLEGIVTKSGWGKNGPKGGYFVSLVQQDKTNSNYPRRSFSAYAIKSVAAELAAAIGNETNCHLYIEGKLWTYFKDKDKSYHMTVLIEKFRKIGPKGHNEK